MKRLILLCLAILPAFWLSAQTVQPAGKTAIQKESAPLTETTNHDNVNKALPGQPSGDFRTGSIGTVIGTTTYDLQSNSTTPKRIVQGPGGKLTVSWTGSTDLTGGGWTDRGTFYNYFDGTNWGIPTTGRLETVRTGWPANLIVPNGVGGHSELIFSHNPLTGVYNLHRISRSTLGTGIWSDTAIAADLVVVGIGIVANQEIAADAGLDVHNGITVDEYGLTSDPRIYAAGDVACHFNPILGRHLRLESWANAQNGGIAVARNLVTEPVPYAELPWFWSDQFDLNLQVVGAPESWERLVTRGDPSTGRCVVFYMVGANVVGATAFNQGREMRACRQLIESGKAVSDGELADKATRLRDLARA